MKGKIIATLIALGMVVSAFAMLATPVNAATPSTWHFIDTVSWSDFRIRDTTSDACDPNGGVARWLVVDTPAQVNTDVSTDDGTPFPSMSAWIGSAGRAGADYYVYVQTSATQAEPTAGEPVLFFLEKDPNIAAAPQVYNPTSALPPFAGGTVPDGHIWVGADVMAWGDAEVLIGASPPDTFFEVLDMPTPDISGAPSITWAGVTHPADVTGNTNANIASWQLYESAADTGPWVQVGTAAFGAPINYALTASNWYSVGVTYTGGVLGMVLSTPIQNGFVPPGVSPQTVIGAETGVVLNGDISNEFVTITCTVTDADGDNVIGAEIEIPTGGPTYAMTTVSPAGSSRVYTYQYDLPNGQLIGPVNYRIHGQDNDEGWNATWTADTFSYADTTAPVLMWNTQPAATIYTTQPATFQISYGDFAAVNLAVGNTWIRWQVNGGGYTNYALANDSFAWGSFTYMLGYSIPGSTFVNGDVIDYDARVQDGNGNFALLAGGSFTVQDAPPGVQDPFVVYGRVYLYNGVGGVYTPILSTGGEVVTATWISNFDGSTLTYTDTTNALGQFSIDLLNYTDGAEVLLTTTFNGFANNNGYNHTTIVEAVGSVEQNVICGVPYEVTITAPAPLSNQQSGIGFNAIYQVYDRDGAAAQGYYTFTDGDMVWTSSDVAFVPPAANTFNGVADLGTATDFLTLFSGGIQWINISETVCDFYPTPWDNFQVMTGFAAGAPVYADGWFDDYDQIDVNVLAGGFDWNVVAGWNIVSVPQDPVNHGLLGGFDSYDALEYCAWQLPGFTQLSLADRTGPGAYNVFDYGMGEAAAFPMDGVHAYWVFCDVTPLVPVHFNSTNYSGVGDNVVNAVAGWNLLGFTHNFTAWTNTPDAAEFTDGTVDAGLDIAGALTKIVATEWLELAAPQWYHSYVVTDTFPGMATHNWAWDFVYSGQPGNGFFLWVDAPTTITFDVEY